MDEYEDRGLQDSMHRALIQTATSIDGVTPLEIARVAAGGPATPADVETFLSSVRLTGRLQTIWSDRCPSPGLLARAVPQPGQTAERRELAEATWKLVALHAEECPRCTALATVLASRSGADNQLLLDLGRSGQDWLGPVRPLLDESPDWVDLAVLDDRLLVRAHAVLAGAVVYLTVACASPEVRRVILRLKGSRAVAELSMPAVSDNMYVDIAVQRWAGVQPWRVDLPGRLAAAGDDITTVDRRLLLMAPQQKKEEE